MSTTFHFRCPSCGADRTASKKIAGRRVRCPECNHMIVVPNPEPEDIPHATPVEEEEDESFDPYYVWLAIPPSEQPPNYYRLLGVALFEPDPNVIAISADRQMLHVKAQATGRYVKQSQMLLNELGRARAVLLDPKKRAAYDAELRAQLQTAGHPAATATKSDEEELGLAPVDDDEELGLAPLDDDEPTARATKTRHASSNDDLDLAPIDDDDQPSSPPARSTGRTLTGTTVAAPKPTSASKPTSPAASQKPAAKSGRTSSASTGSVRRGPSIPVQRDSRRAGSAGTAAGQPAARQPAPRRVVRRRAAPVREFEPVQIRRTSREDLEAEMDMTPMVDVTFLLLIFFMVTAAFSLQRSMEMPTPKQDQASTNVQSIEDIQQDPDFVIVQVDQFNTYRVITTDWEEEAPNDHDLLVYLRRAREGNKEGKKPTRLLVVAHADALYDKVITALDAGASVGMEEVQVTMTEEEL